jgi:hypothetical protein
MRTKKQSLPRESGSQEKRANACPEEFRGAKIKRGRHSESPIFSKNIQKRNDDCFHAAFAANSLRSLRETFNTSLVRKEESPDVQLEGNLNWNDYDLIFPISDLYSGKIG